MKIFVLIFLILSFAVPIYAGDYEDGMAAGRKGDFKTAVEKFKLAGEQGHPMAQFTLGLLYGAGRGVTQDKKESVKWYRRAAEQGHAVAQFAPQ